jgi:hypothetical protein
VIGPLDRNVRRKPGLRPGVIWTEVLMKTCTLCGNSVPNLAESHVYPKALHLQFSDARGDVPPFVINRKAAHPNQTVQKSRGGIYGEFACQVCESKLFGPADNEFMRLHHQLSSWPAPDAPIEMAPNLVPGNPDLLHRFALQTLWRWAVCSRNDIEQVDAVGFGPIIERIRCWLLNPAGTLWTMHDVAASYRIACDSGVVIPPRGGWRAGMIVMTVGNFSFFIASRVRGLRGSLHTHRLQDEGEVRLLATTAMHDWILDPVVDVLGEGGINHVDEFVERMRAHSRKNAE